MLTAAPCLDCVCRRACTGVRTGVHRCVCTYVCVQMHMCRRVHSCVCRRVHSCAQVCVHAHVPPCWLPDGLSRRSLHSALCPGVFVSLPWPGWPLAWRVRAAALCPSTGHPSTCQSPGACWSSCCQCVPHRQRVLQAPSLPLSPRLPGTPARAVWRAELAGLSGTAATGHVWPLTTWNAASVEF